jgi:glutaredoxin
LLHLDEGGGIHVTLLCLRCPRLSRWLRSGAASLLLTILLATSAAATRPSVEMWSREGCPYCAEARAFLDDLRERRPELRIIVYDVVRDPTARERLLVLSEQYGVQRPGVPSFLVEGRLLVGWEGAEVSGSALEALIAGAGAPAPPGRGVETRLFGSVDPGKLGLPLFTAVIGLLDGFNPCAMWVLVFLLSLLVNLRDRGKVILIGGTFVLASGIVYFAFMAAWLNVFLLVGVSRATRIALGAVAILIGALNIKDFVAFGHGLSLSIPRAAKPAIYARVRRVLQAENVGAAFGAVIVLALMVNTVELLCTSGLPAVYTQILAGQRLPAWQYYGYLVLYNLFYMLDDTLLLAAVVVTLRLTRLQEKGARVLKLISGVVMLILGIALALKPEWLEWGRLPL